MQQIVSRKSQAQQGMIDVQQQSKVSKMSESKSTASLVIGNRNQDQREQLKKMILDKFLEKMGKEQADLKIKRLIEDEVNFFFEQNPLIDERMLKNLRNVVNETKEGQAPDYSSLASSTPKKTPITGIKHIDIMNSYQVGSINVNPNFISSTEKKSIELDPLDRLQQQISSTPNIQNTYMSQSYNQKLHFNKNNSSIINLQELDNLPKKQATIEFLRSQSKDKIPLINNSELYESVVMNEQELEESKENNQLPGVSSMPQINENAFQSLTQEEIKAIYAAEISTNKSTSKFSKDKDDDKWQILAQYEAQQGKREKLVRKLEIQDANRQFQEALDQQLSQQQYHDMLEKQQYQQYLGLKEIDRKQFLQEQKTKREKFLEKFQDMIDQNQLQIEVKKEQKNLEEKKELEMIDFMISQDQERKMMEDMEKKEKIWHEKQQLGLIRMQQAEEKKLAQLEQKAQQEKQQKRIERHNKHFLDQKQKEKKDQIQMQEKMQEITNLVSSHIIRGNEQLRQIKKQEEDRYVKIVEENMKKERERIAADEKGKMEKKRKLIEELNKQMSEQKYLEDKKQSDYEQYVGQIRKSAFNFMMEQKEAKIRKRLEQQQHMDDLESQIQVRDQINTMPSMTRDEIIYNKERLKKAGVAVDTLLQET